MAYFLQFDGVDDRLTTPSFTYTAIVMDFKVNSKAAFERYWSLPFSAEYFQVATGGVNDQWSAGVSTFQKDGVGQTNNTVIMTTGTRAVARAVFAAAKTNTCYFMHNNSAAYAHGDIWDIKFYNEATLVCHYDMSTQTVNDQSGNGRHGTLVGGTFVDDGTGGATVFEKSAAITGLATVTASFNKVSPRSAAISGVATVSASARKVMQKTAAITANASVTASARKVFQKAASIVGTSTVTATHRKIRAGVATIQATATVNATAIKRIFASAFIVGIANVTATVKHGDAISKKIKVYGGRSLYETIRGGRTLHVEVKGARTLRVQVKGGV